MHFYLTEDVSEHEHGIVIGRTCQLPSENSFFFLESFEYVLTFPTRGNFGANPGNAVAGDLPRDRSCAFSVRYYCPA